ncbi:uncharacterized protein [Dysidea avara]|uniref:uncharacterized protein isoform X2 n=1 Tax=Dysidea avara TaxID=196820 RepID=UPI003318D2E9
MWLEAGEIRLYLLPWLLLVIFAPQWIKAEDLRLRPVIVNTTVESNGFHHSVLLCWEVNKYVPTKIRSYLIYCNCSEYTMKNNIRVNTLCTQQPCWFKCHYFAMIVDACFDTCRCFVYGQPRYLPGSRSYWSEQHDFRLGPTVPRAPPFVSSPVVRINEKMSLQVYLKLPELNDSYCDADTVKGATVVITTEKYNTSLEYRISNQEITKTRGQYKFTLLLQGSYFWNTMNLAISVNNSIGASPLTNLFTVKGAVNSDITPGSYQLLNDNITNDSASFHWSLSYIPQSMFESGFITGFYYDVELLNKSKVDMCNKCGINFTISSLRPGQWYLLTAGLNTTDDSSWAPESWTIAFKTNQGVDSSKTVTDQQDNTVEVIAWSVSVAGIGSFVIILVITALCLKPYCSKSERRFQEAISLHELRTHISSIPRRTNSDVESLSVTSTESNDSISAGEYIQIRSNHSVR